MNDETENRMEDCEERDGEASNVTGRHSIKSFNLICPSCDNVSESYKQLRDHIETVHDFCINVKVESFESEDEFKARKECVEKRNLCRFVNRRGCRDVAEGKRYHFECHRSGVFENLEAPEHV